MNTMTKHDCRSSTATYSVCEGYRHELFREWRPNGCNGLKALWVMLNSSFGYFNTVLILRGYVRIVFRMNLHIAAG